MPGPQTGADGGSNGGETAVAATTTSSTGAIGSCGLGSKHRVHTNICNESSFHARQAGEMYALGDVDKCECIAHIDKFIQTIGKFRCIRDVNNLLDRHVTARKNLDLVFESAGIRDARVALKPPPVPPHSNNGDVSRRDAARHGTLD
eukprot:5583521-Pleurochrysis_carterae.AAC.1